MSLLSHLNHLAGGVRLHSNRPEASVYGGPISVSKPITLKTLREKYAKGIPLSMVTAYDYPSAVHVDEAHIDMLLVGDSVAMVVHGHDTTLPLTLDEMLTHCKAVARGARRSFLIGDMPFGSFEESDSQAVRSAVRMLKEGQMDAVKIEGGFPARVEGIKRVVQAGVAVIGHVGLTPQAISVLGGFRPAAQSAHEALRVMKEARALQDAGCFSLVLECVPGVVSAGITRQLDIPTIGIGAGAGCSGQVLVYHDLLGMMQHPHHAKVTPKFCKQYASVGSVIEKALGDYVHDVLSGEFPGKQYAPYKIPRREAMELAQALKKEGMDEAASTVEEAVEEKTGGVD